MKARKNLFYALKSCTRYLINTLISLSVPNKKCRYETYTISKFG
jgi:hypothetical protein